MDVHQFNSKWLSRFRLLDLLITDGKEKPGEKKATRIVMSEIVRRTKNDYIPNLKDYDLTEDKITRFDSFCEKLIKRITPQEGIQKLLDKGYYRTALTMATESGSSIRLELIKLVLLRCSSIMDCDSWYLITSERLQNMQFPTGLDFDVFLDKLLGLYKELHLLRNMETISKDIYGIEFPEEVFVNFRKKVEAFEIPRNSSYNYAGRRVCEHRKRKALNKNLVFAA